MSTILDMFRQVAEKLGLLELFMEVSLLTSFIMSLGVLAIRISHW